MADDPIIVPTPTADPANQEGGATPAQAMPAFDPSALQEGLTAAIRSGFEGIAQQIIQPTAAPVAPVQPSQADPLANTLNPYLQPVQLSAASATDAAVFYATTDSAKAYAAKIEELARQYPTTPRATLWQYIRGSDEYIQAEVQRRLDEQKRAAEVAAQGSALGIGGPQRQGYAGPVRQASEMPPEDLAKALEGYSF